MDDRAVYVPLEPFSRIADDGEETSRPAALIAVERETGGTRWALQIATSQPPLLTNGLVLVASEQELQAIDPLIALWVPFLLFAALAIWMYYTVAHVPGGQPIGALERVAAKGGQRLRGLLRFFQRTPKAA